MSVWGPFPGGTNDALCVQSFGLNALLKRYLKFGETEFQILADMGYKISDQVLVNYRGRNLTRAQKLYNRAHNFHRTAAEWGILCISENWSRFSSPKSLKVNKSPVGSQFHIAAFFTNLQTVINRGNRVSLAYKTLPPTLEQFKQGYNL